MEEDDFARGVTQGNLATDPEQVDLEEGKVDLGPPPNHDYADHNQSFKYEEEKSMFAKGPKNSEDMVVPAHHLKQPIDFATIGEEAFDGGSYVPVNDNNVELRLDQIPQS